MEGDVLLDKIHKTTNENLNLKKSVSVELNNEMKENREILNINTRKEYLRTMKDMRKDKQHSDIQLTQTKPDRRNPCLHSNIDVMFEKKPHQTKNSAVTTYSNAYEMDRLLQIIKNKNYKTRGLERNSKATSITSIPTQNYRLKNPHTQNYRLKNPPSHFVSLTNIQRDFDRTPTTMTLKNTRSTLTSISKQHNYSKSQTNIQTIFPKQIQVIYPTTSGNHYFFRREVGTDQTDISVQNADNHLSNAMENKILVQDIYNKTGDNRKNWKTNDQNVTVMTTGSFLNSFISVKDCREQNIELNELKQLYDKVTDVIINAVKNLQRSDIHDISEFLENYLNKTDETDEKLFCDITPDMPRWAIRGFIQYDASNNTIQIVAGLLEKMAKFIIHTKGEIIKDDITNFCSELQKKNHNNHDIRTDRKLRLSIEALNQAKLKYKGTELIQQRSVQRSKESLTQSKESLNRQNTEQKTYGKQNSALILSSSNDSQKPKNSRFQLNSAMKNIGSIVFIKTFNTSLVTGNWNKGISTSITNPNCNEIPINQKGTQSRLMSQNAFKSLQSTIAPVRKNVSNTSTTQGALTNNNSEIRLSLHKKYLPIPKPLTPPVHSPYSQVFPRIDSNMNQRISQRRVPRENQENEIKPQLTERENVIHTDKVGSFSARYGTHTPQPTARPTSSKEIAIRQTKNFIYSNKTEIAKQRFTNQAKMQSNVQYYDTFNISRPINAKMLTSNVEHDEKLNNQNINYHTKSKNDIHIKGTAISLTESDEETAKKNRIPPIPQPLKTSKTYSVFKPFYNKQHRTNTESSIAKSINGKSNSNQSFTSTSEQKEGYRNSVTIRNSKTSSKIPIRFQ